MRIDGDQAVTEGYSFRPGGEILEVVHAAGARVTKYTPEMCVFRFALFDDVVTEAVMADYGAGMDFESIKILDVCIQRGVRAIAASIGEMRLCAVGGLSSGPVSGGVVSAS